MSPDPFSAPISRDVFLRGSLKAFALTALPAGALGTTVHCGPGGPVPELKGLSAQQYHNMNAIGEVFLAGNPIADFDLGKAFDDYLFGKVYPLPNTTVSKALELASVPSSILAALALDGSLTTLVGLDPRAREERMLGWRDSGVVLKKGLFNIMRSTAYFMLASRAEWYEYCGYPRGVMGMVRG